jgi:Domain of unknown function (DUF4252)
MRLTRIVFLAVITTSVAALAQLQPQPAQAQQAQAPQPDWTPQSIEALGQNASSRTDFTLDHSMLVMASKMDQDDEDLRRVIAGVNGVSVHSYHFPRPGMYDPDLLIAVRQQYRAAGWKHMVSAHDKDGGPGATDLWVHFEKNVISNIAVLFASQNQLNFIAVSGSISPLDLLRLAGRFGIPKIDGGVVVPAPGSDRQFE